MSAGFADGTPTSASATSRPPGPSSTASPTIASMGSRRRRRRRSACPRRARGTPAGARAGCVPRAGARVASDFGGGRARAKRRRSGAASGGGARRRRATPGRGGRRCSRGERPRTVRRGVLPRPRATSAHRAARHVRRVATTPALAEMRGRNGVRRAQHVANRAAVRSSISWTKIGLTHQHACGFKYELALTREPAQRRRPGACAAARPSPARPRDASPRDARASPEVVAAWRPATAPHRTRFLQVVTPSSCQSKESPPWSSGTAVQLQTTADLPVRVPKNPSRARATHELAKGRFSRVHRDEMS